MRNETIGVLGGLGPDTTAHFYLGLVRLATETTRPPVCIWSLPMNLRKEQEYVRQGRHTSYYFSLLRAGAEALINAGSSTIVIPCNTVHEFHSRLSASVKVPVTNLIEVVANEVVNRRWKKVFLLATSRTIQTRLYQNALSKKDVEVEFPSTPDQAQLDDLIEGLLGDKSNEDHQKFLKRLVIQSHTSQVVLGCTDLQLLFHGSNNVIDSMQTLAEYTAKKGRKV